MTGIRRDTVIVDGVVAYKHPLHNTWKGVLGRCRRETDKDYKNYGARGIDVCDLWANSFLEFVNYLGPRPEGTTLDRIDNNKGYEPGNVRWATAKEQGQNTRRTRMIHYNGITQCLTDWIEMLVNLEQADEHYRPLPTGVGTSPKSGRNPHRRRETLG